MNLLCLDWSRCRHIGPNISYLVSSLGNKEAYRIILRLIQKAIPVSGYVRLHPSSRPRDIQPE